MLTSFVTQYLFAVFRCATNMKLFLLLCICINQYDYYVHVLINHLNSHSPLHTMKLVYRSNHTSEYKLNYTKTIVLSINKLPLFILKL